MDENPFGTVDAYFEQLMQRYHRLVYNFACMLTHDTDEADDVAQITFHQTYLYLNNHPYAQLDKPQSFLRVSARNVYNNLHRSRPSTDHSLEAIAMQERNTDALQLTAAYAIPDITAASNEGVSEICRQIHALSDTQVREPTSLYFLHNMSYAEIADMLGRPIGTIKNQIHRGRKALKEGLHSWADYGEI